MSVERRVCERHIANAHRQKKTPFWLPVAGACYPCKREPRCTCILFSPLTRLLQGAHFPSRQATLGLTHIPFRAVPVPPHHHHHHHPGLRRPPAQQFGLSSGWGTSRCRGARRQMCLSARWLAVVKSMPVLCLQMPAQKRLRVYQGCLADRLPRWLCHHCRTHSSCDRRRPAHRGSKGQDRCKMMPSQSLTARVETKP